MDNTSVTSIFLLEANVLKWQDCLQSQGATKKNLNGANLIFKLSGIIEFEFQTILVS